MTSSIIDSLSNLVSGVFDVAAGSAKGLWAELTAFVEGLLSS